MTALTNAYWPGNVDHLQNVVANLALNAGTADITRSRGDYLGKGGTGFGVRLLIELAESLC